MFRAGLIFASTPFLLLLCGCTESSGPPPDDAASIQPAPAQSGSSSADRASRIGAPEPSAGARVWSAPGPQPRFVDAAIALGVDFQFFEDRVPGRFLLPEVMGGGAGWLDYDGDGWRDLYFPNGAVLDPQSDSPAVPGDRMFRNFRGERFTDVSSIVQAAAGGYGQGVAAGDFDADGFTDVFISRYGNDQLLKNNGDGTFSDVTAEAGIGDPLWSTSSAWVDLNGDRLADIYCANYMDVTLGNSEVCDYGGRPGYCGPGKYRGIHDAVWLNLGNGQFREASAELGLTAAPSKGLALAVIDLDRDLQPEIYVANDMESNLLFTQSGTATGGVRWREAASSAGAAVSADGMNEASMGVAAADYDRDGLPDLYLTHYYQMKNTLYRNLGGLLFEDDSLRTGVAATSLAYLGFGTIPIDYNLDGLPDVFIANGHVLGPAIEPNAMTPQLLRNTGAGFEDISRFSGRYFVDAWIGRGVAGADFDNDGDTDIAVSHIDRPVSVLRNDTLDSPAFVQLELLRPDRGSVVGARVAVRSGELSSEQTLSTGGSYLSTNDSRLLFPASGATADIEITWPDGAVEQHQGVAVGRQFLCLPGRRVEAIQ